MTDITTRERISHRVPLWRDVIVLKWVTQVFLLFVVLSAMWFLANQAGDNLRARNINTDFDFLERPVDIQISEGIDTHPNTGGRALWSAMVNTLRLSISGIFFATILGVIVGTYSSIFVASVMLLRLGVKRDWSKPTDTTGNQFGDIDA